MRYFLLLLLPLLAACQAEPSTAAVSPPPPPDPPKILFDTDIGGDIDDLGALWALNVYADRRDVEIVGIGSCWSMVDHVRGIDAINTYFGRGDTPVGKFEDGPYHKNEYTWHLAENFPHDLTYDTAPGAVPMYRKLLAEAADTSITLITVGPLRNIERLLKSGPDSLSELSGEALVNRKVKEVFMMGGNYRTFNPNEANFRNGGPGVSKYVLEHIRRPITFNGGTIGNRRDGFGTGARLNDLPADNPMRQGYGFFFKNPPEWSALEPNDTIPDWSIWDVITIQVAATGPQDYWKVVSNGHVEIDEEGLTTWVTGPPSNHAYLAPAMDPGTYAESIVEPLFLAEPLIRQ